jgi:hypothetical protein
MQVSGPSSSYGLPHTNLMYIRSMSYAHIYSRVQYYELVLLPAHSGLRRFVACGCDATNVAVITGKKDGMCEARNPQKLRRAPQPRRVICPSCTVLLRSSVLANGTIAQLLILFPAPGK